MESQAAIMTIPDMAMSIEEKQDGFLSGQKAAEGGGLQTMPAERMLDADKLARKLTE